MEENKVRERMLDKISPEPNTGCWLWLGADDGRGYGRFHANGKTTGAHRAVYEALVGLVGEGFELDHLCRVPACVNPAHLEPVTGAVNTLRGIGPTAINAVKSECLKGHPLAGDNLKIRRGLRICAECQRAHNRAWWHNRKAING